jgi:hypothetical protein
MRQSESGYQAVYSAIQQVKSVTQLARNINLTLETKKVDRKILKQAQELVAI